MSAASLYRLQSIEQELLQGQQRLQAIRAELADDAPLLQARAALQQAGAALRPLRARLRDLELETAGNETKIRNSGERLYSGAVSNPKELQDLQQEIASLTRRNGELETRSLETMLAIEAGEETQAAAQAALDSLVANRDTAHEQLLGEREGLRASLIGLERRRQQLLPQIPAEELRRYTALRSRRGGLPVAPLRGNSCSLCGIAQTIAVERAARQGRELVACSNCGRILVNL